MGIRRWDKWRPLKWSARSPDFDARSPKSADDVWTVNTACASPSALSDDVRTVGTADAADGASPSALVDKSWLLGRAFAGAVTSA